MEKNYKLITLKIENDSDEKIYSDLISNVFDTSLYYSLAHIKYFATTPCRVKCFVLQREGVSILLMPVIIRDIIINGVKQSYYDIVSPYGYSGPIANRVISEEEYTIFWSLVDQWYRENNIVSEFVRFSLNENHQNYSGVILETLYNVKGKLHDTFESQWNAFLPKVRNNFRKAEKFDLTFKIFEKENLTQEVIQIFSAIYTKTMIRNKASGIYFFPKDYFENLIYNNIESVAIAITYFENIPISAEFIILNKETIFAYLGGTDSKYYKYRPNDFLRVKIINWAIEKGKKFYVLGGGIKNGDGLYKSKKALFPKDENVVFCTGRKIVNEKVYKDLCVISNPDFKITSEESISADFFPHYRNL